MASFDLTESLHRLVKQSLDSGEASSIAEAERQFSGYRVRFTIDAADASNPADQVALLTGVALARRVFLGGVTVEGFLDSPLLVPMPLGSTLREAVVSLGGSTESARSSAIPTIAVGGKPREKADGFHVRLAYSGWRGGVIPGHAPMVLNSEKATPIAAILAAGLAVSEAFLHVSGGTRAAGRRALGLSLWQPHLPCNWMLEDTTEPELRYLPSQLWLLGLGHLGQAYLWALGMLPYKDPSSLHLMLQDVDCITPSSESTCILSNQSMCGRKKTRAMAEWAERRGFQTSICERLFDASFRRQEDEPSTVLCGIDNALGRRALDDAGFDFIVEAGVGRSHRDYSALRLHTLPGARPASELWRENGRAEDLGDRPAYRDIMDKGVMDQCGVTMLAGKAVGAPFVGAVAACLAVAEVLRLLHGGRLHSMIEMDLQSIEHRTVVGRADTLSELNPGFVFAT